MDSNFSGIDALRPYIVGYVFECALQCPRL